MDAQSGLSSSVASGAQFLSSCRQARRSRAVSEQRGSRYLRPEAEAGVELSQVARGPEHLRRVRAEAQAGERQAPDMGGEGGSDR
jgi:hypothetical protein